MSRLFARAVVMWSTLAIMGLAPSLVLHGQEDRFYLVGDERVMLEPSTSYRAFKLAGETPDFRALADSLPDAITVEEPFLLEEYNLILLPDTASSLSLRGSLEAVRDGLEGVFGDISDVPVFSAGGTDHVLINEFIVQFRPSADSQRDILQEVGATIVQSPEDIPGRYIVTFPALNELEALAASNALHRRRDIVEFSEPNFVLVLPGRPTPPPQQPQQQSNALTPCPPSRNPNDTFYSCQWALSNGGQIGKADADIDADDAWQLLAGVSPLHDVIIAVLDDGVDTEHEDLSSRIVNPYDAWDGDNDQEPNANDAHGTACAGIAAAVSDNALGIAGVGRTARIMPVRIAIGTPWGGWNTTVAKISDGLRTAVNRGAHVLSNSWGGRTPSNLINSAVAYALERDRVVVFATGNEFRTPVDYPARLAVSQAVIAVGATNEWDELKTHTSLDGEWFWGSNFGDAVSVVAPGVHVYTTDNSGSNGYSNTDYESAFNGTSSATPHVSGIVALMLSVNPDLTPPEVKDILQETAEDLGKPGFDRYYGYGRVNAKRAVAEALARR